MARLLEFVTKTFSSNYVGITLVAGTLRRTHSRWHGKAANMLVRFSTNCHEALKTTWLSWPGLPSTENAYRPPSRRRRPRHIL